MKPKCASLLALFLAAAPGSLRASPWLPPPGADLGPIAAHDTDFAARPRWRGAGPIFEKEAGHAGAAEDFLAVRPLFSRRHNTQTDTTKIDVLWPVANYRRDGNASSWRFLLTLGGDTDRANPKSPYHVWVLPFLFWGRDSLGDAYFAAFPLGGTIRDFLTRDAIVFVLFPAYAYSRVNDVETYDVLWPVFSRTTGGGVQSFRVFPFYGRSVRAGKSEKKFVLWPLWTSVSYQYPGATGGGFVLWPLYGHVKMEGQESWLFLPPFFRWSRSKDLNVSYFPWPFLQTSSGEVDKIYVWPLWGRKIRGNLRTGFFLWPVFGTECRADPGERLQRFAARPILFVETRTATGPAAGEAGEVVTDRYVKVWPLCCYQRDEGGRRLRLLDLWPFRSEPVERNWGPFWTVFTYAAHEDAREYEALWGVFRRQREGARQARTSLFPLIAWHASSENGGRRGWSLLKGLLAYERAGDRRSYRLLYLLRLGAAAGSDNAGSADRPEPAPPIEAGAPTGGEDTE